jgi:hypothetical protein
MLRIHIAIIAALELLCQSCSWNYLLQQVNPKTRAVISDFKESGIQIYFKEKTGLKCGVKVENP